MGKVWLLTGTPMTSRPMNYFNLLDLVDSPVADNWMAYAIRYCAGYQFSVGAKKVWNVSGSLEPRRVTRPNKTAGFEKVERRYFGLT